MPLFIPIANLKGGTGKKTIAVNVACELSSKSNQTVLIHADPQGSAMEWTLRAELPVSCQH